MKAPDYFHKGPRFEDRAREKSFNGFKQSSNLICHSLWSLILEVLERQLLMSLVGGLPPPMYPAPSKVWLYLSLLAAPSILGARCAT